MPVTMQSLIRLPHEGRDDLVARLQVSNRQFAAYDGDGLYSQQEQAEAGYKCAVVEQALTALQDQADELDLNAVRANVQAKRAIGFDEDAFGRAWDWLVAALHGWHEPSVQAA